MIKSVFKQRIEMMGYILVEDKMDYVIKDVEEETGDLINVASVSKIYRYVMDTDLSEPNIPEELFELLVLFSSTDIFLRGDAKNYNVICPLTGRFLTKIDDVEVEWSEDGDLRSHMYSIFSDEELRHYHINPNNYKLIEV